MKVAIRADASSRIGSGHVVRCRTLADELCRQGADVRFVCREQPGHLIPLLSDAGHRVAALAPAADVPQSVDAEETIRALNGFAPNWLVVDHYALDEQWEIPLRARAERLFVIDDLANRRHACDALLDQNWFGDGTQHRYDGLVPAQCHRLLGPQYALLQPIFHERRRTLPPRNGRIERLLVFFGGVDSCNQTLTVLDALRDPDVSDLAIDVVIGHTNARAAEIETAAAARAGVTVHRNLSSLADLMARADLMLGAGGATTWERCCLGLPAMVTVAAENQRSFTAALAESGVHYCLGDASTVRAAGWTNAVRELRSSPERVRAYSAAAHRLTDGRGVHRVAPVLMQPVPGVTSGARGRP